MIKLGLPVCTANSIRNKKNKIMKTIKEILGFLTQCIGLTLCLPGYLLLTFGGWFVDLGETLRLNGED